MKWYDKVEWQLFLPIRECEQQLDDREQFLEVNGKIKLTYERTKENKFEVYVVHVRKGSTPKELHDFSETVNQGSIWITLIDRGNRDLWRLGRQLDQKGNDVDDICCETFIVTNGVIRNTNADWVKELPRTGKLDLFSRNIKKMIIWPQKNNRKKVEKSNRLLLAANCSQIEKGWIFEVIKESCICTKKKKEAPLSIEIGQIDTMYTGQVIVQVRTEKNEKYFIKVAINIDHIKRLQKETTILNEIQSNNELDPAIKNVTPQVIASGRKGGRAYRVEKQLKGDSGALFMYSLREREDLVDEAINWVTMLHMNTYKTIEFNNKYQDYVRHVLQRVAVNAGQPDEKFDIRLVAYLYKSFIGKDIPAAFGHGDYWIGNIMYDSSNKKINGVFDWDYSNPNFPLLSDVLHILIHRKWLFSTFRPGTGIIGFLNNSLSKKDKERVSTYLRTFAVNESLVIPLIILYWVHYLDSREFNLSKNRGWYKNAYLMVKKKIETLLE